jgi:murein L,D-transpeptidase YafK
MKKLRKILLILLVLVLAAVLYNRWPEQKLDTSKKIDKIVVLKSERKMEVYSGNELLKTYKISLGSNPKGDKEYEGDGKTPEGKYSISSKNDKSKFHLSLGISYPGKDDKAKANMAGRSPGGDIMIHGLRYAYIGKLHRLGDWTQGCIAVTNKEIEELYEAVAVGTPIEIKP